MFRFRTFTCRLLSVLAIWSGVISVVAAAEPPAGHSPNIVIIYADEK